MFDSINPDDAPQDHDPNLHVLVISRGSLQSLLDGKPALISVPGHDDTPMLVVAGESSEEVRDTIRMAGQHLGAQGLCKLAIGVMTTAEERAQRDETDLPAPIRQRIHRNPN